MGIFKKNNEPDYSNYATKEFDVVGVTFKNESGESRQDVLELLQKRSGGVFKKKRIVARIEQYDYKGNPALAVCSDCGQVGNISEPNVKRVLKLLPTVVFSELLVDYFVDDDRVVYIAKILFYLDK